MAGVCGEALKPNKAELLKNLELGLVPDEEIKRLIRIQLEKRLQWGCKPTCEQEVSHVLNFVRFLRQSQMSIPAEEFATLNEEYNDVPIASLKIMLGRAMKQSCCYFKDEWMTLDEAEEAMLELYCERAHIEDGQRVLDLGCGYGSLILYLARKYKNCHITGLTNSISQKYFIEEQCRDNNLWNVDIILADVTTHETEETFDRIMVIEMLEHMRNYELLLRKISKWMKQDGLLFIEHVCHKTLAYIFEPLDENDWLTECTFPAGTVNIPSANFLLYFQDDVSVVNQWIISGKNFCRTSMEWLKKIDANANANAAKAIMGSKSTSEEGAIRLTNQWRTFLLFQIELFKYNNGEEWMVAHLLFKKK